MSQCLLATTQEVRHKDTRTREMCSAVTEPTVFVSKHKTDRGDTRSFLRLPQNIDTKDEFGLSCSRTNCQRESFCANLSNCCHIKQKYDLKKYESPPNQQHHFKKTKKKRYNDGASLQHQLNIWRCPDIQTMENIFYVWWRDTRSV